MISDFFQNKHKHTCRTKSDAGFTLMELIVATSIFALVTVSMTVLFNYTLQINRRSEALRQAAQGMRDFAEFIVKQVRNGQIYYGVNAIPQDTADTPVGPCLPPTINTVTDFPKTMVGSTYAMKDNKLGLVSLEGDKECLFLGYGPGAAVGKTLGDPVSSQVFGSNTNPGDLAYNPNPVLMFKKGALAAQILNPSNYRIDNLMFIVRPTCNPYSLDCQDYGHGYAKTQPGVTILIKFVAQLPTGEQTAIYYQTSVSTAKYDIPNQ